MFFGRKSPSNLVFFLLIIKVLFSGASRERSLWDAVFRKSTSPFSPLAATADGAKFRLRLHRWRRREGNRLGYFYFLFPILSSVDRAHCSSVSWGGSSQLFLQIQWHFPRKYATNIAHILCSSHCANSPKRGSFSQNDKGHQSFPSRIHMS